MFHGENMLATHIESARDWEHNHQHTGQNMFMNTEIEMRASLHKNKNALQNDIARKPATQQFCRLYIYQSSIFFFKHQTRTMTSIMILSQCCVTKV